MVDINLFKGSVRRITVDELMGKKQAVQNGSVAKSVTKKANPSKARPPGLTHPPGLAEPKPVNISEVKCTSFSFHSFTRTDFVKLRFCVIISITTN